MLLEGLPPLACPFSNVQTPGTPFCPWLQGLAEPVLCNQALLSAYLPCRFQARRHGIGPLRQCAP